MFKLNALFTSILFLTCFDEVYGLEIVSRKIFIVGKTKVTFYKDYETGAIVSEICKQRSCEALALLKNIKSSNGDFYGGASRGSLICRKQLHGKVVIALDEANNENSFCELRDTSLIDIGSLVAIEKQRTP